MFVYQILNDNPQKDNFHNAIFGIDKKVGSGIVNSTFLIDFLFPEGVVDGERPLKYSPWRRIRPQISVPVVISNFCPA
jgi:hypothetical protein